MQGYCNGCGGMSIANGHCTSCGTPVAGAAEAPQVKRRVRTPEQAEASKRAAQPEQRAGRRVRAPSPSVDAAPRSTAQDGPPIIDLQEVVERAKRAATPEVAEMFGELSGIFYDVAQLCHRVQVFAVKHGGGG